MRLSGESLLDTAKTGVALATEAIDAIRAFAHGKPPVETVLDVRAAEPALGAAARQPLSVTMEDHAVLGRAPDGAPILAEPRSIGPITSMTVGRNLVFLPRDATALATFTGRTGMGLFRTAESMGIKSAPDGLPYLHSTAKLPEGMRVQLRAPGREEVADVTPFVYQRPSALADRFKFLQRDRVGHSVAVMPGSTIEIYTPRILASHDQLRRVTIEPVAAKPPVVARPEQ
jgi:hypothetical protein